MKTTLAITAAFLFIVGCSGSEESLQSSQDALREGKIGADCSGGGDGKTCKAGLVCAPKDGSSTKYVCQRPHQETEECTPDYRHYTNADGSFRQGSCAKGLLCAVYGEPGPSGDGGWRCIRADGGKKIASV